MAKKKKSDKDFYIDSRGILRTKDHGFALREDYDKYAKKVQKRQFGSKKKKSSVSVL